MLVRIALAAACLHLVLLATAGAADAGPLAARGAVCTAPGAAPNGDASPASGAAVLCLINAERTLRAVPALTPSSRLERAAARHSADMVRRGYFSHVSPGGTTLSRRVAMTGYRRAGRRPTLGEVLGWGASYFATPVELVKGLMDDAPHRAILLARRFREAGVGLALGVPMEGMDDGGVTLSVNFGAR